MSGDPPGVLAKNSIRERENKEPEKPATKKKPTNEKQPPQETDSNNKNKKKCGGGKFVAERQKSMNASCSSDASSEHSSPLGRESSSSLSWSSGRMAARRIAVVKEEAIWWWWKLFEQLSLSGALAELTWPVIPNKRHVFRPNILGHGDKPTPISPPSSSQDSKSRAHKLGHGERRVFEVLTHDHASGWTNKY
ncbi:hypothetical protein NC651_000508 [Populus alba x Populus x berolinensis]|nr:hypothetical protein NC651_000508 [Populus alba x Populus x berolinensis]